MVVIRIARGGSGGNDRWMLGQEMLDTYSDNTIDFGPWSGRSILRPDEDNQQMSMGLGVEMSLASCFIAANLINNPVTVTNRINTVDGNMVITIGTGLTGFFQDITNTDIVDNDDLVNNIWESPAGGTFLTLQSVAVLCTVL